MRGLQETDIDGSPGRRPTARSPGAGARQAWHRRLLPRVLSHFWLKGIGTTVFMCLFFMGYFQLLRHPVFPVTVMPLTEVDRWVDFHPAALPFYLSLWLYVSLPPALLATRRELVGYGWAIAGLCLLAMACFLVWPTAVPVPAVDWGRFPGFEVLKGMDAGGNACPSLHVATAVFSGLWLHRLLRELGSGPGVLWLNGLWCAGIVYSTLATKQHVALDVVAGLLLGFAGAAWSLRRRGRPVPA